MQALKSRFESARASSVANSSASSQRSSFDSSRLDNDNSSRKPSTAASSSSTKDTPAAAAAAAAPASPEKYLLRVTAGPNYDVSTHRTVPVNSSDALAIENDFMSIRLKVRIQGYHGLPRQSPESSPYFSHPLHKSDQYSLAFSFIPKTDIPSVDTIWGNDFTEPIRDRLPPGFNTAFRIVKMFIDPGLECDAYADKPWMYGPALSCWFAFRIGEHPDPDNNNNVTDLAAQNLSDSAPEEEDVVQEGADGSGKEVRTTAGMPDASEKRRKWALDEANRRKLTFERGRIYHVDFFNPYLDFSNFALKLPGFSIGVLRYIGDKTHTLRYVMKNKNTGDVYMVVELKLLYGQDLQDAVDDDGKGQIQNKGTSHDNDLD